MKRILSVILVLAFMLNLGFPSFLTAKEVSSAKLPEIRITPERLELLKIQPGIRFSQTAPIPGPGEIVVGIHKGLNGGYLVGTPEAFSAGLYAAGITPEVLDPLTFVSGEFARGFTFAPVVTGVSPWLLAAVGAGGLVVYLASTPERRAPTPPAHRP